VRSDCGHPCSRDLYDLKVEAELHSNLIGTFGTNYTFLEDDVILQFYLENPFKSVLEEFSAYDLASFISDCGGIMGMFLGLSFMSIYDSVARFAASFWARFT